MATTQIKPYTLDDYYTDQEKKLARARDEKKRQANLSSMKLQKYLGNDESLARQGYSQGMTETARIAAENSRQKALAAADNDYTDSYSNLMNQYRVEKEAKQQEAFDQAMTTIDSGTWHTTAGLEEYIKGFEGRVSDEHMSDLQSRLEYYRGSSEQKQKELEDTFSGGGFKRSGTKFTVENNGAKGGWSGDNIEVSDGDETYKIQINKALDRSDFGEYNTQMGAYFDEGEIFEYNGKFYLREGDTYYELGQRTNSKKEDWKDFKNAFSKKKQE